MFKDITLGKFTYDGGGEIYLAPGDNMVCDLDSSSCMHELYHAQLALTSNVGVLMHLIEIELNMEQNNFEYIDYLLGISKGLCEATRTVHEVYANSLELLWVEEYYGINMRNKIYESKTDEYIRYLDISKQNWNDEKETVENRRKQISRLCVSVLDMDIFAEEFWRWLDQPTHLAKIIEDRLQYVFRTQECILESRKLDQEDIIELAKMKFKYLADGLEEGFRRSKTYLNVNLTEMLLQNVKVFDFFELGITTGKQFDSKCGAVCVIKTLHIEDGSVRTFIIQNFMADGIYEVVELEKSKIHETLEGKSYVIVPCADFMFNKNEAKCEEINDKIKIVLLDNVKEFKKWIQNIREFDEIYIGDINDKSAENFFTVIYFRKRNCDKVIYMFPTLSMIANNIFEELQVAQEVKYPGNGMGFYNIFSVFNDWAEILKVLKETISFVTKSKGNIIHNENPCSRLLNQIKYDVGDNVFQIVGKDFFHISAVLPTLQTKASPFWLLMEFENGENTGNIKCCVNAIDEKRNEKDKFGIMYFYDKKSAEDYRKRMIKENPELENYQAVGMDELFWLEVKKILNLKKIGMVFGRRGSDVGIWNDRVQFEYLRINEMRRQ